MKTALITGANRFEGIGYHVASKLLAKGWRVIITTRHERTATEVRNALGENALCVTLDLTSPESIASLASRVAALVDHLDVLINNAGALLDGSKNALTVNATTLAESFRINAIGPLMVAQQLIPLLERSDAPRIVNVSSGAAQLADGEPSSWAPAYSASKAALNAITQQLAVCLPRFAVNSVCPGWCRTEMGGMNAPRSADEGAKGIVWLASEAPQSFTGRFVRDGEEISW